MCGIAGVLDPRARDSKQQLESDALRMASTLRHRGPDDEGVWTDAGAGIALAVRRLAVLDLSPAGHQPMVSASGRYCAVFNGEIYNVEQLRQDLPTRKAQQAARQAQAKTAAAASSSTHKATTGTSEKAGKAAASTPLATPPAAPPPVPTTDTPIPKGELTMGGLFDEA